ncbi:hypothetical protein AJ87_38325 [Rhizobium yanglingense]|nr:hypothetical protein AJ87_38325 [Rhizobium yanglingense]
MKDESLDAIVVPFDFDNYNSQATVGENLLFGTMKRPMMNNRKLAAHPYFQQLFRVPASATTSMRWAWKSPKTPSNSSTIYRPTTLFSSS